MDVEKYLIGTPLFAGISIEDIQALLKETRYQTKKYRNQETFIFQNSPCTHLYFLYQGHATAGRMNPTGKYLLVEELYAPKVIAPAFLFNKENRYPVTVNATKTCSVLIIPGQDFLRLLQKNRQLLFNFLNIISNQVIYLSQKVKLSNISIKGKIANFILSNCEEGESVFTSGYTQQKLADLFGVARTSVARCFSEMESAGIISVKNKTITIYNKQQLKDLVE